MTRQLAPGDHAVNDPILHRLARIQDVIPIHIALDFLQRLAGGAGQNLVDDLARSQNLARLDIDVGGLPAQPGGMRLMDQDARIRQTVTLALAPDASRTAAMEAAWPTQ